MRILLLLIVAVIIMLAVAKRNETPSKNPDLLEVEKLEEVNRRNEGSVVSPKRPGSYKQQVNRAREVTEKIKQQREEEGF